MEAWSGSSCRRLGERTWKAEGHCTLQFGQGEWPSNMEDLRGLRREPTLGMRHVSRATALNVCVSTYAGPADLGSCADMLQVELT